MNSPSEGFLEYASAKLRRYAMQIRRCAELLDDAELWRRADPHCNAVGNLILHLTGNVSQWVLGGLAEREVSRDRPAEFAARGVPDRAAMLARFDDAVREACGVIGRLDPAALARRASIQGYDVTRRVAVFHVVEHFAYHAGQIIHATKALRGVSLSLYDAQGQLLSGDDRSTP